MTLETTRNGSASVFASLPIMTSGSYTVEAAVSGDVAAAMKLVRQAKEVFPFLPGVIYEKASAEGELLICRNGLEIVGALHFHHRRDAITTVHEIVVTPRARGRGMGRLLMNALEEAARARGQKRLRLKCPVDQPANGFYARVGFGRTGVEQSRTRHVAVWERPIAPVKKTIGDWDFYASLTAGPSDIRRLFRKYYEGYAAAGTPVPHHPFRRIIFTPLFAPEGTRDLFRNLRGSDESDMAGSIAGVPFALPRPTIMCDSGGYQVQMGKMSYEELCFRLRGMYASLTWGDYYVLPDHVPTSSDSDAEAGAKASNTLAVGENFLSWFPERREKFVGVVHGRTEAQMRAGARHWADLGVSYIAFGSFGTSGPNGSVNLVNNQSIALLSALSEAAYTHGQKVHIFGIGGPEQLRRFREASLNINTYDSANWWKMAGFGYVMGRDRTFRVSQTNRQTHTINDIYLAFLAENHICPYCLELDNLRTHRWSRILHNLSAFLQGAEWYTA